MLSKLPLSWFYLVLFILLIGSYTYSPCSGVDVKTGFYSEKNQQSAGKKSMNATTRDLISLNSRLITWIYSAKPESDIKAIPKGIRAMIDSIKLSIGNPDVDSIPISDSYYLIGICDLLYGNNVSAANNLELALAVREKNGVSDVRLGRILYNLGIAHRGLGDYNKMEDLELRSLDVYKKIYGASSRELIYSYLSLIVAYIELQEYEKAINYSNLAIAIAESKPDSISSRDRSDLYANLGVCYTRLADFSKGRIYLERAKSIYEETNLDFDKNYVNLLNSLATTYDALGLKEKSMSYYENGVALAMTFPVNSAFSFNIINSYAINLGKSGKSQKGEALLKMVLDKARSDREKSPLLYYEVLNNYAEYLQEYNIDNNKSLECFSECLKYLNKSQTETFLYIRVIIGYSLSLAKSGDPMKALDLLQGMIEKNYTIEGNKGDYSNPEIESLKADKISLNIFKTKYQVLWELYKKTGNFKILETASNTAEIIVNLLDKIRINISEEDSRLILGDKYRDSYFNALRDFNLLYNKTSDNKFLEKAFEYSEKSKVAGLLTSTRELKAVQFQIPAEIAEFEFRLKRDIGALSILITEESNKEVADKELINRLNIKLLRNIRMRDSLILVFEKKYPGYYKIKYNTQVVSMKNIGDIVGRDGNYVNYLLSDSLLYIFVANREHKKFLAMPVKNEFYDNIRLFRKLLSMPESSEDAAAAFQLFQTTGFGLYKILIDPIRQYLISDKLIISPDNILSYIPFETIPTAIINETRPLYGSIHYSMEDFEISYTYSATFMAESVKFDYGLRNKLLAFAPNYPEPIYIRSLLNNRQEHTGVLHDLPFARQEAQYVTKITGGRLFENSDAKESVYKNESGKYDIIHLAMHTVLDDKDPMNSTLIFSPESGTQDDSFLKTNEIYGIPLKAKMVVLSSCNTGSGLLFSGEGILSLARGFIYSGSQSVVMSMWEIEDRSGTEIVEKFYENLKKGYQKSSALRKARIDFLKNADQLRSHPYFWSALIVYGNNSRLYYTRFLFIGLSFAGLVAFVIYAFHSRKRKYS